MFLYEIAIEPLKKRWLSLFPFIIIIPALIYGYLRKNGIIIYSTDEPAGFLWSDWDFNGTIIFNLFFAAFLGVLTYFIYSFIKNIFRKK